MLELESVHIPKTAGMSFLKLLQHWYGEERVARHTLGLATPVSFDTLAMHGHVPAGTYNARKRVCWVRDPARRLVSHYVFLRFQQAPGAPSPFLSTHWRIWDGELSFEEFVTLPIARNGLSQWMNGLDVDDFDFVGIQEDFDRELLRCAHILGMPPVTVDGRENATLVPEYEAFRASIDERTLADLRDQNPACTELYERAAQRAEEWWRANGSVTDSRAA